MGEWERIRSTGGCVGSGAASTGAERPHGFVAQHTLLVLTSKQLPWKCRENVKIVTVLQPHRADAGISISCVFCSNTGLLLLPTPYLQTQQSGLPLKQYEKAKFAVSNSIDDSLFTNLGQNWSARNWILLSPAPLLELHEKSETKQREKMQVPAKGQALWGPPSAGLQGAPGTPNRDRQEV